jgi:hypothetical protein
MPPYSQGPRLLKGAIMAIDPATAGHSTIVFQYNPEAVRRSLEPQLAGSEEGAAFAGRALQRRPGGDL